MSVGDGHDGELLYLSPLNAGDVIYAASADGELVAVSTDNGSLIWERELDDRLFAGVGGDQDRLYLITREAELVALARSDGHELWRASLPTEVLSAPQSNGSMVVTQTIDGRVLAFDSGDGHALWQYDGVVPVLSIRAAAAPLVGSDIVIAAFASGKLIALAADSGQPVWQYELGQPQGRTELERLVDIGGQPLVLDSALLAVGYQGKLALVDIRTGQEIWSKKASSLYAPSVADNAIYLASANGDLVALRGSDRRELWCRTSLPGASRPSRCRWATIWCWGILKVTCTQCHVPMAAFRASSSSTMREFAYRHSGWPMVTCSFLATAAAWPFSNSGP